MAAPLSQTEQGSSPDVALPGDFAAAMQAARIPTTPRTAAQDVPTPVTLREPQVLSSTPCEKALLSGATYTTLEPLPLVISSGQAQAASATGVALMQTLELQAKPARNAITQAHVDGSDTEAGIATAGGVAPAALPAPGDLLEPTVPSAAAQAGSDAAQVASETDANTKDPDAVAGTRADPQAHKPHISHGRSEHRLLHKAPAIALQPVQDAQPSTHATTPAADPARSGASALPMSNLAQPSPVYATAEIKPAGTTRMSSSTPASAGPNLIPNTVNTNTGCSQGTGIEGRDDSKGVLLFAEVSVVRPAAGTLHASSVDAADDDGGGLPWLEAKGFVEHTNRSTSRSRAFFELAEGASFSPSISSPSGAMTHSSLTHADVRLAVGGSLMNDSDGVTKPARRLEVAVDDPSLGIVNIRAEMRGGSLHASLTGVAESMVDAAPALHQFLQEHQVSVHAISLSGKHEPAVRSVPIASTDSSPGMSFGGDHSANPQQQAPAASARSAAGKQLSRHNVAGHDASHHSLTYIPSGAFHGSSATVSIHI